MRPCHRTHGYQYPDPRCCGPQIEGIVNSSAAEKRMSRSEIFDQGNLTMRLSDAGLRRRETKALYLDHRPPPWLTEDAPRDRSNRVLDDRATLIEGLARTALMILPRRLVVSKERDWLSDQRRT
jgi:hypothetical protein